MIWIAKYKDGTVLRQYDAGKEISSANLDKDNLESFRITETSGDTAVQFSSDSGVVRFSNLGYEKLVELNGGEKLTLEFDKKTETFKMDSESLRFFNSIALKDERDYFYIEFDQTGRFYVSGQPFYMGYVLEGEDIPFIDQPPYNDFKYTITSNEDFYMSNKSDKPSRKANYVTQYSLRLNRKHKHEKVVFTVSHELIFDVLKSCIILDCIISADRQVNGNLYMVVGGERTANPIPFGKNEPKQIRRMLTMI